MMGTSNAIASISARALELGHRAALIVTGGRWPRTLAGMQTLELRVTGRKSGVARSTLLTAPICDENRVVLVASKAGHSEDPQWYRNLLANPAVEITIHGETRAMQARTATPAERDELWARITQRYRTYARYQARTDREIPVVVCEPT